MAKGRTHRKQHYIPQCFLKGFTGDGKGFYAYDKQRNNSFPLAIKKACQVDDFYKIHRKFVDETERAQFDENYYETAFFANAIEKDFGRLLAALREKIAEWIANPHEDPALDTRSRDLLAGYLGIQLLRLPRVRNNYYQAIKKGEQKRFEIIKGMVAGSDPELKKAAENIILEQDDDYAAIVHAGMYADRQLIDDLQDRLVAKTWAFLVSARNDLYCSDCPIVVIPHFPGQRPYFEGIGMRGAQIIVPVSGNLLISMWDADLFDPKKYRPEQFQPLSAAEKDYFNLCQYANAEEQIFCADGSFGLIENMLKQGSPPLWNIYKSRIEVY